MATERTKIHIYIFVTEVKLQVKLSTQSLHRYTHLMVYKKKKSGDEADVVQCSFTGFTCRNLFQNGTNGKIWLTCMIKDFLF